MSRLLQFASHCADFCSEAHAAAAPTETLSRTATLPFSCEVSAFKHQLYPPLYLSLSLTCPDAAGAAGSGNPPEIRGAFTSACSCPSNPHGEALKYDSDAAGSSAVLKSR